MHAVLDLTRLAVLLQSAPPALGEALGAGKGAAVQQLLRSIASSREVAPAHGGDANVDTGPTGTRFTMTFAAEHAAAPV